MRYSIFLPGCIIISSVLPDSSLEALIDNILANHIRDYVLRGAAKKWRVTQSELADFIWNGSDALFPMNQTIERTNKAPLDYIKSTFVGMCNKKLRECQNVLNNQLEGMLGKFLQGDAPKA